MDEHKREWIDEMAGRMARSPFRRQWPVEVQAKLFAALWLSCHGLEEAWTLVTELGVGGIHCTDGVGATHPSREFLEVYKDGLARHGCQLP